jgi:cytochrome oxidase assembly protein ShyY1
MMNWNGNGSGWMNGGGFVFMSFIFILLVGLGVWLVMRNTRRK